MNEKGILTGLFTVVSYPIELIVGTIVSIIMYPLVVMEVLLDPNTP